MENYYKSENNRFPYVIMNLYTYILSNNNTILFNDRRDSEKNYSNFNINRFLNLFLIIQ